jgi:hypothetical protein
LLQVIVDELLIVLVMNRCFWMRVFHRNHAVAVVGAVNWRQLF